MNAQKCAAMPVPLQCCSIWMGPKPAVWGVGRKGPLAALVAQESTVG